MPRWLTPNVWKVSLVSLFTDISSEMLYPVMPLFMQKMGLSGAAIGLIEGIGEAFAAWGKGFFGMKSDATRKRKPYIVAGYGLSALSKLLMAFSVWPALIYLSRLSDRLGKGIRSSPRDGLLGDEAQVASVGKVFGFHRAMDTVGAAIGPMIALCLLYIFHCSYTQIFFIAFVPALMGWILTLMVSEKPISVAVVKQQHLFSFFGYYREATPEYRRLVKPLILFALFNSSDFFLILNLKHNGFSDIQIILIYICYNLSYALFSYPAGWLADRIGFKYILFTGFVIFIVSYFMMSSLHVLPWAIVAFLLYGLYAATTEGIAKALLSKQAPKNHKASAIGFYNACQALAVVVAGVWTGLVVDNFSFHTAFFITSCGALMVLILLLFTKEK